VELGNSVISHLFVVAEIKNLSLLEDILIEEISFGGMRTPGHSQRASSLLRKLVSQYDRNCLKFGALQHHLCEGGELGEDKGKYE